ncbi:SpoIIE family protein phosphatase [Uniformispora flossi]|uniref:SpoIIE family protein phosphatase n=1 Tax=Uniformispora flossi TaxID=3390723 RepID=UPI003C2AFB0A
MSSAVTPLPGPRAVGAYAPAWSWSGLQDALEPLLADITDTCAGFAEVAAVLVHVSHDDIAELRGAAGLVADGTPEPATVHLYSRILHDERLPVTDALHTGRPVILEDRVLGTARYPRHDSRTWGEGAGACVCVPMSGTIGSAPDPAEPARGVLTVAFRDTVPFDRRLLARIRAYAELIGDEIARLGDPPRAEDFLGAHTDAAPRRASGRRSAALARAEATLATLDAVGTGTFDWDLAAGQVAFDTRLSRVFGLEGRYSGPIEPVLCAFHRDDFPGLRLQLAEAFTADDVFHVGHRLHDADGREHWVEVRAGVAPADRDRPRRLRGVVTDVTELPDLRLTLARQAEEIDALVIVVDGEWRLVYANAASERLFRRPRADILGHPLHALLPEARHHGWGRRLFTALQEHRAQTFTLHVPEDDRWFRVSAYPRQRQMLLFCVEITAERRHEAKLREAAQVAAAQQARIQLLTAALAESLTVHEVVRAARRMPAVCGADGLAIGMVQDGRLRVVGHAGYPPRAAAGYPVWELDDDAPFVEAIRRRSAFAIRSRAEYLRRYPHLDILADAAGRQAWVFLPLIASGESVGTAVLSYNRERDFGPDDFRLFGQLRALLARALHRARRYDDEHAMSAGLQRGLLPGRPARIGGLTIATRYIPATVGMQVGGDWHDVISLPNGKAGLVIGDVQGHGVDAAAIMGMLRTAVLAYAVEGHEPSEVVRRTNALTAGLGTDLFATCAYVEFDPSNGRAVIVRAGHTHPAVLGRDGTRLVDVPGGLPLGIDTGARYPATEVALAPGDVLVLCTDGLVESRGLSLDDGVAWMLDTLEHGRGMTPDGLAGHLIARRIGELGDDIALLLARYDGAGRA